MNLVHHFRLWQTTDTRQPARYEGEVRASSLTEAEAMVMQFGRDRDCGYFHVDLSGLRFEEGEPGVLACKAA